jgi:hypothetical protein
MLSFFLFLGIIVSIFIFIIQQHKLNHKHE